MSDSANDAKQYAFRLLRYRDRSEQELSERLRRKGFPEETVSRTIGFLKEASLVNDRALAKSLDEIARNVRLLGDRGVRQFLKSRGISDELVPEPPSSALDEFERALTLTKRRAKSLEGYPTKIRMRKLRGYLMRRGYSFPTVRKVMNRVFGTSPDDELEE
ncbi:MAG: regulatory protein RecX [bacterium]